MKKMQQENIPTNAQQKRGEAKSVHTFKVKTALDAKNHTRAQSLGKQRVASQPMEAALPSRAVQDIFYPPLPLESQSKMTLSTEKPHTRPKTGISH